MKKTTSYRRNKKNTSLFEQESTVQSLSEMGNPLEFISGIVDFELFRPTLEAHLLNEERKSNAGRRPIDPVLMFKVMFLQRLYGLSDEQAEYQIKDRTSFREFLGILTVTDVPDARTIWKYRETLSKSGGYDAMFRTFTIIRNTGSYSSRGQDDRRKFRCLPASATPGKKTPP